MNQQPNGVQLLVQDVPMDGKTVFWFQTGALPWQAHYRLKMAPLVLGRPANVVPCARLCDNQYQEINQDTLVIAQELPTLALLL